ncbi:MAG: THUMP domain-containing protein [Candidatus Hermodarchaeota archaeon]
MSFLVSSQRSLERDALSEAYYVISDVLKYKVKPRRSFVPGLAILSLSENEVNLFEVINRIREYIDTEGPLIACLKIVPLEKLIKTHLPLIIEHALSLAKLKIKPSNSWKIHVRKRQTNLRSSHVIEKVAELINWGKVNLSDPDFEVRIEIIRNITGVTVMEPHFEINMVKLAKMM